MRREAQRCHSEGKWQHAFQGIVPKVPEYRITNKEPQNVEGGDFDIGNSLFDVLRFKEDHSMTAQRANWIPDLVRDEVAERGIPDRPGMREAFAYFDEEKKMFVFLLYWIG